jgi:hypothetical protein
VMRWRSPGEGAEPPCQLMRTGGRRGTEAACNQPGRGQGGTMEVGTRSSSTPGCALAYPQTMNYQRAFTDSRGCSAVAMAASQADATLEQGTIQYQGHTGKH